MKPIGSEKLKGKEGIQRILDLTYYQSQNDEPTSTSSADYISESEIGVFGIVREKDGYYVKKGLTESTLDYIGGLFMKNHNKFSSYAEALKRLQLLEGQENLQEATKYVLKTPKPNPVEATPPQPEMDTTATPPVGGDAGLPPDLGAEPTPGDEFGGSPEGEELDPVKGIQKTTGKLSEKIRDYGEKIEGDDVKYVLNSVLAAFGKNLFKMDSTDLEDVVSKFEDNGNEDEMGGGDEFAPDDMGAGQEEAPAEVSEYGSEDSDLDEIMRKFEEITNTPLQDDDDCCGDGEFSDDDIEGYEDEVSDEDEFGHRSKRRAGGEWPKSDDELEMGEEEQSVREFDINELTDLVNQTVKETLTKYLS